MEEEIVEDLTKDDDEQYYNDENGDFDPEYEETFQTAHTVTGPPGTRGGFGVRQWGPRFRGRGGFGPPGTVPPMRGRGGLPPFPRGRGVNRFGGPNFDQNWGPPPGVMGNGPPQFGPPGMNGPPHMMNNGPPGQFPPGMGPPPSMMQELWVETKTAEGKSYYYQAISRETTWTRPEGPHVKVMTQTDVEAMNKQQQQQQMQQQQQQQSNNDKPHEISMEAVQNNMHEIKVDPPQQTNQFFGPPPQFSGGMPQFGMPPPGYQSFQNQWSAPPAQWQPNPGLDQAKALSNVKISDIDPSIVAKAAEWTEHKAPDGRPYFYNASKGESVWEKPQALKDLDVAKLAALHASQQEQVAVAAAAAAAAAAIAAAAAAFIPQQPAMPHEVPPQIQGPSSIVFDPLGFIMKNDKQVNLEEEKEKKRKLELEKKKKEEEEKAKLAKPLDKSRPISSTPISGTPWCVVWTGDGRVFFYNPSSRTSVWERPEELLERADVDKAISVPPQQLLGNVPKEPEEEPETLPIITMNQKSESESSADSDEAPNKKSKIDPDSTLKPAQSVLTNKNPADIGKEAAMEAEIRAARERALVPLEVRVKSFKEMLKEKDVSAFSTWEKELHKIVFDPRYLLLTSRERKQVFEKYVKDRAEEERREKRNKMRQKRDEFRGLMEATPLHGKSSFSDFAQKFGKDDRFKVIEKIRERESLFNEYIVEVRKKEKDDKQNKKEQMRKDFIAMLREHSEIDRHSRWTDVKKRVEMDSRYRTVGDPMLREDYFLEFCKIMKDEKKRAKEKERERKEKKVERREKNREKGSKEKKEKSREKSSEKDKEKDSRDYQDGEHPMTSEDEADRQQKERDRQLRAEASIKEREKEVQRTLATHLRDRDKERQHHQRDEAIRHFSALLADLVRNADLTWKEVKKQLKKDHRWELVESLDRDDKERLFNDHINGLAKKKRDKFREMLEEIPHLELTSSWKEIKKIIRDDPRYVKLNSSERCEREFRDYIKDKTSNAKAAFRELLIECKFITHKSYELYRENPNHLKEVEEILKNDKRYLVLNHMYHDRTQIVLMYLEDLNKRGPPPPPTASESTRRK